MHRLPMLLVAAAVTVAGVAGIVGACRGDSTPGPVAPQALSQPSAVGAATIQGQGYVIEVSPPATAGANAPARIRVTAKPGSGYHMNTEFPTSLVITPPAGVELAKDRLAGADAARFEEAGLDFDVTFTSKDAGDKAFTAVFKFAVCTPESCIPKRESLAWTVAVK